MAEYIDRIAFREKLDCHYPFDEIGEAYKFCYGCGAQMIGGDDDV